VNPDEFTEDAFLADINNTGSDEEGGDDLDYTMDSLEDNSDNDQVDHDEDEEDDDNDNDEVGSILCKCASSDHCCWALLNKLIGF
jgi:hypothetical protein